MSRLEIKKSDAVQRSVENMYEVLERRMIAGAIDSCPADFHLGFLKMCHAQTCGKCASCRIGLRQLQNLLTDVLENRATVNTLELIRRTAKAIYETADCAIGYEAARMVYNGVNECYEDYVRYIENGGYIEATTVAVPCVDNCPASVDIPGYVALVGEGRYEDAVRLIRKDNPFPTACAYVCEHPCERKCRRRIIDSPINIRGLKRAAVDYAENIPAPVCSESTGKRVAIIGGGPSGLSAAYYLQMMGHQVTVYEAKPRLGGMLRYGIPSYRFPREKLQEDIDAILELGVEVKRNTMVGRDVTIQALILQYDAVYIAIGAQTDKKMGIEGEDADKVVSAVDLLNKIGHEEFPDFTGENIIILGGGNVAMDCARSSIRLGASKVTIVYRRRQEDMPALPDEIESAIAEGVEIKPLMVPLRIEKDENGTATGLWVKPQMISLCDRKGRPSPKDSSKPEQLIPCDRVIVAIGQNIDFKHFESSGIEVKRGVIDALDDGMIRDKEGVFAGGDCVTGPATVIRAIEGGKVAAANIDAFLGYQHMISCDVEIPRDNVHNRLPCGRANMVERESGERKCDFAGVELGLSKEEACQEASRCLRCDYYGYGSLKGGRTTQW